MRTGPKALVGLGLPAALRPHAPDKGVPDSITVDGVTYGRLRFGGEFLDRLLSSQLLYGRL